MPRPHGKCFSIQGRRQKRKSRQGYGNDDAVIDRDFHGLYRSGHSRFHSGGSLACHLSGFGPSGFQCELYLHADLLWHHFIQLYERPGAGAVRYGDGGHRQYAALLCFSFSKGMLGFCLLAIPLGLGAGSVDTALNNYVALHYRAQHINFLHCFYGVGVSLSPYLMSLALADNNDWRRGYRVVFLIQAGIALLLLVSTPLWKKLVSSQTAQETQNRVLTIRESLRRRHALSCVGVLMGSCAIEAICLVWGATFLAGTKGIAADRAAAILTFYYVGLALGRFVSGIVAGKLASKTIIVIGQCITLAAIVTIALPLSYAIAGVGLFFVGFGNGPLFPNMTHLIPRVFGRDVSQSMIGVLMGFSSVSILLAPLLFGRVVHAFGVHLFPYFLLVMFAVMTGATAVLFRRFSAAAEEE